MGNEALVKVRLRIRDRPAELLAAEPLLAPEGGLAFRLANTAFGTPVRIGDLVRTRLDGYDCPQVVAVAALDEGAWSRVEHPPGLPEPEIRAALREWERAGALWSERDGRTIVTAWATGLAARDVRGRIEALAPHWRVRVVLIGTERAAAVAREVIFELDPETPDDDGEEGW